MNETKAKLVVSAEDRTARVFAGIRANLGGVAGDAGLVGRSFTGLGPLIAGAFTAGGLASFIKGTVDGIDKLNDLSDATGSSVAKLSGLEDVAARNGTSLDTVGAALQRLQKNLIEAEDPTSRAAKLFEALGLNAAELGKLDVSDALVVVARSLSTFADGAKKGRFELELLGKQSRDLSPFLRDVADAGTINATVFQQQTDEAQKFNKQLFELQKDATDAARALTGSLLPALSNVFDAYRKYGGLKGLGLAIIGEDDLSRAQAGAEALRAESIRVGDSIDRISTELKRDPGNVLLQGRLDKAREKLAALTAESAAASAQIKTLANELGGKPGRPANEGGGRFGAPDLPDIPDGRGGGGGGGGGGLAVRDRTTEAQRYLETLQRQLQGTEQLSVAETVLADIQAGRLKLAKGESREPLLTVAREIDAARRRADQLKAEAEQVRDLADANRALADEGARVFDATRTPRERLDADLARTRELFGKGAIDTETYAREVLRLNDAFDQLGDKKAVVEELDSFTVRAAQNIQDALGDELTSVLQGNFRNIGDSFKRTLDRMVAEALAADINRALFGNLAKSGGSGGGLFGTLLSFGGSLFGASGGPGINGGSMLPNSLRGGAATGANALERDMITMVHKGEAIVPKAYNPAAGGKGTGMTVVQHFAISGPASRETQNQIAAAAALGLDRARNRFT